MGYREVNMRFGSFKSGRIFPEWMRVAAPTIAAVAGVSLIGVVPAVIASGTKYLTFMAVAAGVPFVLLLLMGGILALVLPQQADPPDGGGGPPRPSGPDDPPWWPEFEKEFRGYVTASDQGSPDAGSLVVQAAPAAGRPLVKVATGF